jgi:hypothetical protein
MAGCSAAVAAFYTFLFVPILPFAAVGLAWFGIGALPFAPLGGLVGALSQGLPLSRRAPHGRRTFWSAAACGVAVLVALEVPGWMVVRGLEAESVELLERWGSRDTLLRAAQSGTSAVNLSAHCEAAFFRSRNSARAARS